MTELPREIGGWRVLARLGSGGMGTVYRARRDGVDAAVKVIHPGLAADSTFRTRFRREIIIAQLAEGQHVAKVLGFDLDAPAPWLATELLDGQPLSEIVSAEGPLRDEELLALARGLAQGIRDLHEAGIVHRDVKPSNIMLTTRGPVLVDFGISTAVEMTALTHTGIRLGSPGWMAPEQIDGNRPSPATDTFSWGLVLAYAATGMNPFGTGSTDAILHRIRTAEPDLGAVPTPWRALIAAALHKDPDERPTDHLLVSATLDNAALTAFASACTPTEAATVTGPVQATSVATHQLTALEVVQPESHGRRRWLLVSGALAALLLVALAGGGAWALMRNPARSPGATASGTRHAAGKSDSPPVRRSSGARPTTPKANDAALTAGAPEYSATIHTNDEAAIRKLAAFLHTHLQQKVRLDIRWFVDAPAQYQRSKTPDTVDVVPPYDSAFWNAPQADTLGGDGIGFSFHGPLSDLTSIDSLSGHQDLAGTFIPTSDTITQGLYVVDLRDAHAPSGHSPATATPSRTTVTIHFRGITSGSIQPQWLSDHGYHDATLGPYQITDGLARYSEPTADLKHTSVEVESGQVMHGYGIGAATFIITAYDQLEAGTPVTKAMVAKRKSVLATTCLPASDHPGSLDLDVQVLPIRTPGTGQSAVAYSTTTLATTGKEFRTDMWIAGAQDTPPC